MPILPRLAGLRALWLMLVAILAAAAAWSDEGSRTDSDQRVAHLIEELGDQDFRVRQRAQGDLSKLGFQAYDALSAAAHHEDLEIASRARYLLGLMRMHWWVPSDPPVVREQLDKYWLEDVEGRSQRIRALARLQEGAGLAALCRLVRYEESELLSKYAAVEILNWEPVDRAGQARLTQLVGEQLGPSTRTAAKWLLTFQKLCENPGAEETAWLEQVESENALAKSSPGESNPRIVVALLYRLAEAQDKQGRTEEAEATVQRARQLNPGNAPAQLVMRLEIAQVLQHRGLFPWADQEYQQVIQARVSEYAFVAQVARAEMWHDQGENLIGAKSLEQALALLQQISPGNVGYADRTPGELRARMNYFLACHWGEQKDPVQQLKYLEEALDNDKAEIDVLIALWKTAGLSPEARSRVGKLIDRATAELRREIISPSGDPATYANACNQFAWLVGNTQGDLDEALSYSLKSIELAPSSGAFHDTLAHVYFAKGDLANAVRNQTKAAELEPHSGLIRQALIRFRAALKQEQARPEASRLSNPKATTTATP